MMIDYTGSAEQLEALTVACRACEAEIGQVCVDRADNDRPLTRFPGHPVRVNDARAQRGDAPAPWYAADAVDLDSPQPRDFSEPSHGPAGEEQ